MTILNRQALCGGPSGVTSCQQLANASSDWGVTVSHRSNMDRDEEAAQLLYSLIDALPVAEQTAAARGVLHAIADARSAHSPQPIVAYLSSLERSADVHHNPIFHKRLQEADGQIAEKVGIEHVDSKVFLNELAALRG